MILIMFCEVCEASLLKCSCISQVIHYLLLQVSILYEAKMNFQIIDPMRMGNIVVITALGVAVRLGKLLLWITEYLISGFELLTCSEGAIYSSAL